MGSFKNRWMCSGIFFMAFIYSIESYSQGPRPSEKDKYYPSYHYFPSGDPTGLFYYNGYYYNNWGVARSKDLVHWEYTPYGQLKNKIWQLRQDTTLSEAVKDSLSQVQTRLGGSGTIVVDWENTSGFGKNGHPPLVSFWHNGIPPWNNQVIGVAYSNDTARSWTRYEKFPVLDINSREFRDPKVFWHEPTQKWVMAIGWADVPKIKFFSSNNLKDWEFLSDFGPWGAVEGVWECVDLFQLPVEGDQSQSKWVMIISVQPLSGQYFIGDFDGEKFTLDPDFKMDLIHEDYKPQGEVLFDFETGIDGWVMEGDAFIESPSNQALLHQGAIMGQEGRFFINSFHNQAASTGKIISPDFTVTKDYLNFLVGGGYHPDDESVNLIVDGKIVRSQSGNHSGGLQWAGWDVSEFKGKKANIEIVDKLADQVGYIYVDHIMLSDEMAKTEREQAFWFDYGPDFFAARAWNNYLEGENRTIWTAWMGSWRYGGTEPVRGIQAVPRSLELKKFPEGIRLTQHPIKELESLRKKHRKEGEHIVEGIWMPKNIKTSKNAYEIIAEFEVISAEEFGLKLCIGENEKTVVGYSVADEELFVDRRNSGYDEFIDLFPQLSKGPMPNRNNTVKLHIYVDHSSIEVFGNNGETVISSKIYPDPSSLGIELFSNRGKVKVKSIDLWELESIHLGSD